MSTEREIPSDDRYKYGPFPDGPSIRILTILPGEWDQKIEVRLRTVPFVPDSPDDIPEYQALSYVWGSEDHPVNITIFTYPQDHTKGDGNMSVTRNLECALRHLRYPDKSREMWIDALCIDQLNLAEKGPQVAMMGSIYQHAKSVVVWLGPEENDSDRAMEIVSFLGQQVHTTAHDAWIEPAPDAGGPNIGGTGPNGPADFEALVNLFSREWFRRLWVRQEIAIAQRNRWSAYVLCGKGREIPFGVFWDVWYSLTYQQGHQRNSPSPPRWARRFFSLQGFLDQHAYTRFELLHQDFFFSDCKNPRDRIYGVLSMLAPDQQKAVESLNPDYNKPVVEVFTDIVLRNLRHLRNCNILTQCRFRHEPPGGFWPTWVPDWTYQDESDRSRSCSFNASGPFTVKWSQPQPGILRIRGVSAGTVEHVFTHDLAAYPEPEDPDRAASIMRRMCQDLLAVTANKIPFEEFLQRLARVLCHYRHVDHLPAIGAKIRNEIILLRHLVSDDLPIWHDIENAGTTLTRWRSHLSGKQLVVTSQDLIALVPKTAVQGDEICVMFGCDLPMVLRPEKSKTTGRLQHLVVGPCCVAGAVFGELVLGPLPKGVRWTLSQNIYRNGQVSYVYKGILDLPDGDPRLEGVVAREALGKYQGEFQDDSWARIDVDDLDMEVLRARGVVVQDYDLA